MTSGKTTREEPSSAARRVHSATSSNVFSTLAHTVAACTTDTLSLRAMLHRTSSDAGTETAVVEVSKEREGGRSLSGSFAKSKPKLSRFPERGSASDHDLADDPSPSRPPTTTSCSLSSTSLYRRRIVELKNAPSPAPSHAEVDPRLSSAPFEARSKLLPRRPRPVSQKGRRRLGHSSSTGS